jgi:hypothetical protein
MFRRSLALAAVLLTIGAPAASACQAKHTLSPREQAHRAGGALAPSAAIGVLPGAGFAVAFAAARRRRR